MASAPGVSDAPSARSASEIAAEIMRFEPATEKTAEILESFKLPLNSRPPLASTPCESICAAHGSNFSTALQVLRNANGQLVDHSRLVELRIVW